MRILITGKTGQLGRCLIDTKPKNIQIIAPSKNDLDLSNSEECENIIKEIKPDWLINCGHLQMLMLQKPKKILS